jgi:hypothetical protein
MLIFPAEPRAFGSGALLSPTTEHAISDWRRDRIAWLCAG